MMRLRQCRLLVGLTLFVLYASNLWAQTPQTAKPQMAKPAAEGTGRAGDSPTKWAVYLPGEAAAPGETIAATESVIGTIGAGGILSSVFIYFAGIEGRTLQLYRIEKENLREQTRYPIHLPLAADNTTVLRLRPLYADRFVFVRFRLGDDNLLTATLAK